MPESSTSRLKRRCGFVILLLSAILWTVTTVFFIGVWDQVAAVTTFPQWSWALVGSLCAMIAWRLLGRGARLPVMLLALWLLTTLLFADNLLPVVRGLVHGSVPANPAPAGTFRIATLNCASSDLLSRTLYPGRFAGVGYSSVAIASTRTPAGRSPMTADSSAMATAKSYQLATPASVQ